MPLQPGTRIRRYEVSHLLAAGGMGEVYLARDVELGRDVALKILPQDASDEGDADRVRRFLQEARAAIALSHPNVAHIYDAGDDNGLRFMAMEYVQGETLRARISREPLNVDQALDILLQVTAAVASAHAAGIVHRDIKPENVMLRPDGYVKVLDFGLAKWTERSGPDEPTRVVHTAQGVVMGTVHYMAPEQLRAADVDARADVFSLGVMMCELLSGRRPFVASTPSGVIAAILTEEPSLDAVPAELRPLVQTALAKNPSDRFPSAREMNEALRRARGRSSGLRAADIPTEALTNPVVAKPARRWIPIAIAIVICIVAAGAWWIARQQKITAARASLPRVEQLAAAGRYFEAWDLATSLQNILGNDERLTRALQKMSEEITVRTDPPGARVHLQRVLADGSEGPRQLAGTTPLEKHVVSRGNYILHVEKDGYAERARPLNMQPLSIAGSSLQQPAPVIEWKLLKKNEVPEGMVLVDGGRYELTGWMDISDERVTLDPFFIDRYEVSNGDFEQFIRAGGYRRRELWKEPFVKDGRELSFEEATALFRDATGLLGPRSWAQGKYPEGRRDYPVTDITWYEAAAYAEHAGKKLPTLFQWDKAARNGARAWAGNIYPWGMMESDADVNPRANFRGAGPLPVHSLASGMSTWGVHHLAGNVAEFVRNRVDDGFGATGGGFDDPTYEFGELGSYPGFFSSPKLGFRCVREVVTNDRDQGGFKLTTSRPQIELPAPAGEAEFAKIRRLYDYDRTPLQARVIERIETADWMREKVAYIGARGKTALAYVYLPRGVRAPYQAVHYLPPSDVARGARTLPMSMEASMAGIVRGGRVLFGVVLEGYLERKSGSSSTQDANELADHIVDLRRGLDYITSRADIDPNRIGLFNPSAGTTAYVLTAVDERYDAIAFVGSSFGSASLVDFIPRIRPPKVLFHGKYDEVNPLTTDAQPVFDLMQGRKELVTYDGGHIPPTGWMVPRLIAWFDQLFGPVGT